MVGRRSKRNLKDSDDKEVKKQKNDLEEVNENDALKKVDEDEDEDDTPPMKKDKQEQEDENDEKDNEQLVGDSQLETQSDEIKNEIEKVKISPVAERKDEEHNDTDVDCNENGDEGEERKVVEQLEEDEVIHESESKDTTKQEEEENENEGNDEEKEKAPVVDEDEKEKEQTGNTDSDKKLEGFSYAEASGVNQESSFVPTVASVFINPDNLQLPSSSSYFPSPDAGIDNNNVNSDTNTTDTMLIPANKVGAVIGSKGGVIRDLSMKTGCKVQLYQDSPPGQPKPLVLTGTKQQIMEAKRLVNKVLVEGPTAMHNALALSNTSVINATIDCPPTVVGRLIGPSGSAIKELQIQSGARIFINQNVPDGADRKVLITGSQQAVDLAISLCHTVMQNGIQAITGQGQGVSHGQYGQRNTSGRGQPHGGRNTNRYGPNGGGGGSHQFNPVNPAAASMAAHSQTQIIDCPRNLVGRLIGKGGENANLIQSRSGCRMRIEQNVPEGAPCRIHVTGIPPAIALASQIIQEVMVSGTNRIVSMPIPNFHGGVPGPSLAPNFLPMVGGPQFMPGVPMGMPMGMPSGHGGHPQMMPGMMGGPNIPMNMNVGVNGMPMNPVHMMHNQHMSQPQQQLQQHGDSSSDNHHNGGGGGVWSQHCTDTGKTYYHNALTGVSSWTRPE